MSSRVVILGAAGRDFHNFNVALRDDSVFGVIAFTAAQIPGIAGRCYPASLAGARYPQGIPIVPETELETLMRDRGADMVVFAYSDITHLQVMHLASRALAAGADFMLLGPHRTMLPARVPVIAVSLRMADVVVVSKTDAAAAVDVHRVMQNARALNVRAVIVCGKSPVVLEDADAVRGRRVLAVEDGPTVTHGGMPYGAEFVAATRAGAAVIDPRPWAAPEIAAVYARYPHLGPVLPATGYSARQIEALRETIERASVDAVVAGTPADLATLLRISKPVVRARYEFAEASEPGLWGEVQKFLGHDVKARSMKLTK